MRTILTIAAIAFAGLAHAQYPDSSCDVEARMQRIPDMIKANDQSQDWRRTPVAVYRGGHDTLIWADDPRRFVSAIFLVSNLCRHEKRWAAEAAEKAASVKP